MRDSNKRLKKEETTRFFFLTDNVDPAGPAAAVPAMAAIARRENFMFVFELLLRMVEDDRRPDRQKSEQRTKL